MYKIPEEIIREATANHPCLNIEIRQLMIELGVSVQMIGISQFGRDKSEAFSLSTAVGGTHSVPVHAQVYIPEINVDLAVLDPNFPHMVSNSPSWSNANFRDRAQAVIVHEFEEAMIHDRGVYHNEYPVTISNALLQIQSGNFEESVMGQLLVHDYGHYGAIRNAVQTKLRYVSATARRILEQYHERARTFS